MSQYILNMLFDKVGGIYIYCTFVGHYNVQLCAKYRFSLIVVIVSLIVPFYTICHQLSSIANVIITYFMSFFFMIT